MELLGNIKNIGGGGKSQLNPCLTRFRGVLESDRKNKSSFFSAFTLAEMMVVMLILSIVLAAMAPVMTTRNKPNNSTPWKYDTSVNTSARNDIWFGTGTRQHVMIGQSKLKESEIDAKLYIATRNLGGSMIAFGSGDKPFGHLLMNGYGTLLIGSNKSTANGLGSLALGQYVNATGQESIVLGTAANKKPVTASGRQSTLIAHSSYYSDGAEASGDSSIGIGVDVKSKGSDSIAIGKSEALSNDSIAIGSTVSAKSYQSIAIGSHANAGTKDADDQIIGSNNVAIGYYANSIGEDSIAIGYLTNSKAKGAIAIGNHADSGSEDDEGNIIGERSIAIGQNVGAIGDDSIAIGASTDYPLTQANYHKDVVIGFNALTDKTRDSEVTGSSIAIGNEATSYDSSAIAIGSKAKSQLKSIAIGENAKIEEGSLLNSSGSIAIGVSANAKTFRDVQVSGSRFVHGERGSIALGSNTQANAGGIAIGSSNIIKTSSAADSLKQVNTIRDGSTRSFGGGIAIGNDVTSYNDDSVAIGSSIDARGLNSIAIGKKVKTWEDNGIAIGTEAMAGYDSTIAIGNGAKAKAENSIVIGNNIENKRPNVVQLGDDTQSVYIPGNLIVGGRTYLGVDIPFQAYGHYAPLYVQVGRKKGANYGLHQVKTLSKDWEKHDDDLYLRYEYGTTANPLAATTSSDRRLKYVGKENTSGLDKIRQLKVFNYTFKKDAKKEPHVGVIAQDLQKIFPNAVKKGADGFLIIRMEDMFYAVINAIKELDAKYQAQEKRINELEKRIEKLEAKVK